MPHFAAFLLNPGTAHIPDLNNFLPWDEEWFSDGISRETLRVTHACVKNEYNQYSPTWLQHGESIRKHIVELLSKKVLKHQSDAQVIATVVRRPRKEKE